jgi:hypothetical protein
MSSDLKGTPPVEGALLFDPRILSPDQESGMPRMSDEFALTPLTALAYFIPAIMVLILGLDWTVFVICIAFEVIVFLWSRVIQMWIMPGGGGAVMATLFMLQPIGAVTLAFLFILVWLLSGVPININGKPYEITLGSRGAALLAMAALSADALRRFREITLPRIHFMQRVNERYMFDGEPNRKLFTGLRTIIENILLSFFGGTLAGLYVGMAMLVTFLAAQILNVFVSEERAWATGAVIGFSAVRLAWEALRAALQHKADPQTKTEGAILQRLATVSQKRIVLRDSG